MNIEHLGAGFVLRGITDMDIINFTSCILSRERMEFVFFDKLSYTCFIVGSFLGVVSNIVELLKVYDVVQLRMSGDLVWSLVNNL